MEAVVPSTRRRTYNYYRLSHKRQSEPRETKPKKAVTPELSEDESCDDSSYESNNERLDKERENCPQDVCLPLAESYIWPSSQRQDTKVDADTTSITPSTTSARWTKAHGQPILMTLFGSNPKPRTPQRRIVAERRHHTTIPVTGESAATETTPADSNESSPSKSNKHTAPGAPQGSSNGGKPSVQSTKPQQRKVTCTTCLDDEIPVLKSAKLECGHRMCHACLKRVFLLSTQDPQLMPPKCCTDTGIPLEHVKRLFSNKFKLLWNKKYDEYTTRNRLYCPAKGCGEWIDPKYIKLDRTVGRRYGACPKCKTKACKRCGRRWHGTRDCDNDADTAALLDMGREQGWQRCYSCRAMVQLSEGCNHMRCRCNAEFCYLCGVKWKTCECPWFNVPPDQQAPMPWADFFPVDVRRYRVPDDGAVPMPPPPLPHIFRDRRDMPLDPLNPPYMFRPPDIPLPPPQPVRPTRSRRYRRDQLTEEGQQVDQQQRQTQEAEDEAMARRLQEQEINAGLGFGDLNLHENRSGRDAAARRERRRRRQTATQDDDNWQDRLRPIEVGEGAVREA